MNAFTIGLIVFFALLAVAAVFAAFQRPTYGFDRRRRAIVEGDAQYRHGPPPSNLHGGGGPSF